MTAISSFPDRKTVAEIKKKYVKGDRVRLIRMNDVQAPPAGTEGTVTGVDDIGTVFVKWDNGSGLGVAYGEDVVELIGKE